jgi:hypothetical protein
MNIQEFTDFIPGVLPRTSFRVIKGGIDPRRFQSGVMGHDRIEYQNQLAISLLLRDICHYQTPREAGERQEWQ